MSVSTHLLPRESSSTKNARATGNSYADGSHPTREGVPGL